MGSGLAPGIETTPRRQFGSLWSRLVPGPMGLEGALPLEGLGSQACGAQQARSSLGAAAGWQMVLLPGWAQLRFHPQHVPSVPSAGRVLLLSPLLPGSVIQEWVLL